eukprot:g4086.t1
MSLRTPAIPDDFPHFLAWYGRVPTFDYLKESDSGSGGGLFSSNNSKDSYSCTDYWFKLRQLVDSRYYMHWMYSDSSSYTGGAYLEALEDIATCRRIAKLPAHDRPLETREWFRKRHKRNAVWKYKQPPEGVGKWDNYTGLDVGGGPAQS